MLASISPSDVPSTPTAATAELAQSYSKIQRLLIQSTFYSKGIADILAAGEAPPAAGPSTPPPHDEIENPIAEDGPAAPEASTSSPRASRNRVGGAVLPKSPKVVKARVNAPSKRKADLKLAVESEKRIKIAVQPTKEFKQPSLVTGGTLKDYQLRGVQWLSSIYTNGINGILADEMGLGKTLQSIAFIALLIEKGVRGPFLIISPMSVLNTWESEFARFAPSIETCLYHGSVADRAAMRTDRLGMANAKGKKTKKVDMLPIIITSYEIILKDSKFLSRLPFNLIVVDEGQRLKNSKTKFSTELNTFTTANKLLLTGTPIQNNLSELWSLLSFLMSDIFNDLAAFQGFFDAALSVDNGSSAIVEQLHSILKPFMLRRLKTDVEKNLPPKKEYLLFAPLTVEQKTLYDATVNRELHSFLIKQELGFDGVVPATKEVDDTPEGQRRTRHKGVRVPGKEYSELGDREYFESLGESKQEGPTMSSEEAGRAHLQAQAKRTVGNKRLQNLVMQLRKVCNHPALFHDRRFDGAMSSDSDKHALLATSGKMLLLNRLLFGEKGLFATGHKVILFSQFTTQLDIIHEWLNDVKGMPCYRIDGVTSREDRKAQMEAFNDPSDPLDCKIFLLSTRAGGVGITLTAADTVILFDSDWNPQADLQAMDRAHRIGQKNPVLVFRFTTNTIEAKILARAKDKRQLEALVIGQGDYKMDREDMAGALGRGTKKIQPMLDIVESLSSHEEHLVLAKEGDLIMSDEHLERLLDRSDATMHSKVSFSTEVTVLNTGEDEKDTVGFSMDMEEIEAVDEPNMEEIVIE